MKYVIIALASCVAADILVKLLTMLISVGAIWLLLAIGLFYGLNKKFGSQLETQLNKVFSKTRKAKA